MIRLVLFLIPSAFSLVGFSQQSYEIRDEISNQPVPFVKVYPNIGSPFITDLDGHMTLSDSVTSITLKCYDYGDTLIHIGELQGLVIFLSTLSQEIVGVEVVSGTNQAHRIIALAIDNRKKNHPLANDAFTYKSYSKFIFDVNPDGVAAIPDSTTDSTMIKMKEFLTSQHLFMMESASKRTFIPPYRDKEEIIAYKISGFSDPMFSTFANSFQSFSFYENQFDLLGKQYINPIARGGIRRYFFILEDTTIINRDTTFTISYRPRAGKNFTGLKGYLFINSNGYAVEKVIAEPYNDTSGMQMRIVQEYEFIDGKKWFPIKLSTELDLKGLMTSPNMKNLYVQGRGNTYIDEIEINPEIKKRFFNDNVTISASEHAAELDNSTWDSIRRFEITDKEENTYHTIDSLSEAYNFNRFLGLAKILAEGKAPLGKYFNLNLDRMLNYNFYEKYRFGAGIETSQKLMKPLQIGGYFAWATGDKRWKYGGKATVHLNRKHGIRLDFNYHQDNLERGGQLFHENLPLISNDLYRQLFISQMDEQRLGEIVFSWDIKANVELKLLGNYQRIWHSEEYSYLPDGSREMDLAETGVELTWNILEKSMLLGSRKVSLGRKYPQIRIKAVQGWKGWFESDYAYTRLNAEISQTVPVRAIGTFNWKIAASKLVGDAPLTRSYNGNGTGRSWFISAINSFETMLPGSFYTTSQVGLFTRFDFKAIATKAKWNEPKFGVHHAIGFGEFVNRQDHSLNFETMDNGYYEAGLILDGILTTKTASIGLGAFYKYGPYASTDWLQNLVPKLVFSFRLE
ncbi:MAG: hypothetical protein ACI865_002020 [Flavobacteriaceae bacterium]|jgi:hypothetical protein